MKLPKDQKKKLMEYVQDSWKPPIQCPLCKGNEWVPSEEIYEIREFHGGGLVLGGGGKISPIFPITCRICGNTVLINPLVAGIDLKKIAEETEEAARRAKAADEQVRKEYQTVSGEELKKKIEEKTQEAFKKAVGEVAKQGAAEGAAEGGKEGSNG